ncbi:MAG: glycoside hydrolase family 31 protein [Mobilitalea sp.]
MDKSYQINPSPLSKQKNTVRGDYYRFTILTPYLIRMEYDEEGRFEDRATQSVIFRDFETQKFQVIEKNDSLQIITDAIHILYDKKRFSKNGLTVKVRWNLTAYHSIWNYSDPVKDLKGTARTLDGVDGEIELEQGILSQNGFSIIDDSNSFLLTEEGWLEQRRKGVIDLYFLGYGRNYKQCLKDFYRLTGETPLLPKYALGNWWSRFYRYTEQSYRTLIERFEEEKLPFTVAVMDMDWHLTDLDSKLGSGWTGYTWNKELFPDPEAFMKWLHEKGLRITLNVHPAEGVRAHEEMYTAMAEELGIDSKSEIPIAFDVTNQEFLKAYFKYLHHDKEKEGVDFWWIDWQQGNHSKIEGLDPLWMLNHFHFQDLQRNGKRALILSRYAGIGSHRYPIGFSGDSIISWESLKFQPYFTATASNIGFGWWSHDIGGHMDGIRDDELAARWLQFGVFSPILRLHSSGSMFNGKEPWRYNDIAHAVMNRFLQLRHQMLPYLYTMNYRSSVQGEPLIQPMYYQFPNISQAYEVGNQYYFGSELIVAPITEKMDHSLNLAKTKVWLPEGSYIDFFQGIIYEGNRYLEMYRGLDTIPVLAKAGGIIPMNGCSDILNDLSNPKELEIRIFAGEDGQFCLYEDDGESLEYKKEAFVKTTMILDWHKNKYFKISASEGHTGLIPERRNYKLKFIGFQDCEDISVTLGGTILQFTKKYDVASNLLELTVESVEVTKELSVQFEIMEICGNKTEEMLLQFLDQAQIEFQLKERIYYLFKRNSNIAKIMTELHMMNLGQNLFGVLCEILLAS